MARDEGAQPVVRGQRNRRLHLGGQLDQRAQPGRRAVRHPLKTFDEEIADAAPVPGGIAVLLTEAGKSWDNDRPASP